MACSYVLLNCFMKYPQLKESRTTRDKQNLRVPVGLSALFALAACSDSDLAPPAMESPPHPTDNNTPQLISIGNRRYSIQLSENTAYEIEPELPADLAAALASSNVDVSTFASYGIELNITNGQATFSQAPTITGTSSNVVGIFTIVTTNQQNETELYTISVGIDNTNDAPEALGNTQIAVPASNSIQLLNHFYDRDGDALSFSIVTGDSKFSIEGTTQQPTLLSSANIESGDAVVLAIGDGETVITTTITFDDAIDTVSISSLSPITGIVEHAGFQRTIALDDLFNFGSQYDIDDFNFVINFTLDDDFASGVYASTSEGMLEVGGTVDFYGTPDATESMVIFVHANAKDGSASAVNLVTLEIENVDDPVQVLNDTSSFNLIEGTAASEDSLDLGMLFSDPDGKQIDYVLSELSTNLRGLEIEGLNFSIVNNVLEIAGKPVINANEYANDNNFLALGDSVVAQLTITATDTTNLPALSVVTITVANTLDALSAVELNENFQVTHQFSDTAYAYAANQEFEISIHDLFLHADGFGDVEFFYQYSDNDLTNQGIFGLVDGEFVFEELAADQFDPSKIYRVTITAVDTGEGADARGTYIDRAIVEVPFIFQKVMNFPEVLNDSINLDSIRTGTAVSITLALDSYFVNTDDALNYSVDVYSAGGFDETAFGLTASIDYGSNEFILEGSSARMPIFDNRDKLAALLSIDIYASDPVELSRSKISTGVVVFDYNLPPTTVDFFLPTSAQLSIVEESPYNLDIVLSDIFADSDSDTLAYEFTLIGAGGFGLGNATSYNGISFQQTVKDGKDVIRVEGSLDGIEGHVDALGISIVASDGIASTVQNITFDIVLKNDRPTASAETASVSSQSGQALRIAGGEFFSDEENDALSYSITSSSLASLIPNLAIDSSTGAITGAVGYAKIDSEHVIVVTATDPGGLQATKTIALSIEGVDYDLEINLEGYNTNFGDTAEQTLWTVTRDFQGVFTDPEGEEITYSFAERTLTEGLVLSGLTVSLSSDLKLTVTGTPILSPSDPQDMDYILPEKAKFAVDLIAREGNNSKTVTHEFTITNVNDAPSALAGAVASQLFLYSGSNTEFQYSEQIPLVGLFADKDGFGDLSFEISHIAGQGVSISATLVDSDLRISATGVINSKPEATQFAITATDAAGEKAIITIDLNFQEFVLPEFENLEFSENIETSVSVDLGAGYSVPLENINVSYQLFDSWQFGSEEISLSDAGVLTISPNLRSIETLEDVLGTIIVAVVNEDTNVTLDYASIDFSIANENDAPVLNAKNVPTILLYQPSPTSYLYNLSEAFGPDPEGGQLSYSIETDADSFVFGINTSADGDQLWMTGFAPNNTHVTITVHATDQAIEGDLDELRHTLASTITFRAAEFDPAFETLGTSDESRPAVSATAGVALDHTFTISIDNKSDFDFVAHFDALFVNHHTAFADAHLFAANAAAQQARALLERKTFSDGWVLEPAASDYISDTQNENETLTSQASGEDGVVRYQWNDLVPTLQGVQIVVHDVEGGIEVEIAGTPYINYRHIEDGTISDPTLIAQLTAYRAWLGDSVTLRLGVYGEAVHDSDGGVGSASPGIPDARLGEEGYVYADRYVSIELGSRAPSIQHTLRQTATLTDGETGVRLLDYISDADFDLLPSGFGFTTSAGLQLVADTDADVVAANAEYPVLVLKNGAPNAFGTYTLTITATDLASNVTETEVVVVIAAPPDPADDSPEAANSSPHSDEIGVIAGGALYSDLQFGDIDGDGYDDVLLKLVTGGTARIYWGEEVTNSGERFAYGDLAATDAVTDWLDINFDHTDLNGGLSVDGSAYALHPGVFAGTEGHAIVLAKADLTEFHIVDASQLDKSVASYDASSLAGLSVAAQAFSGDGGFVRVAELTGDTTSDFVFLREASGGSGHELVVIDGIPNLGTYVEAYSIAIEYDTSAGMPHVVAADLFGVGSNQLLVLSDDGLGGGLQVLDGGAADVREQTVYANPTATGHVVRAPTGSFAEVMNIGDFDGDGRDDIILREKGTGAPSDRWWLLTDLASMNTADAASATGDIAAWAASSPYRQGQVLLITVADADLTIDGIDAADISGNGAADLLIHVSSADSAVGDMRYVLPGQFSSAGLDRLATEYNDAGVAVLNLDQTAYAEWPTGNALVGVADWLDEQIVIFEETVDGSTQRTAWYAPNLRDNGSSNVNARTEPLGESLREFAQATHVFQEIDSTIQILQRGDLNNDGISDTVLLLNARALVVFGDSTDHARLFDQSALFHDIDYETSEDDVASFLLTSGKFLYDPQARSGLFLDVDGDGAKDLILPTLSAAGNSATDHQILLHIVQGGDDYASSNNLQNADATTIDLIAPAAPVSTTIAAQSVALHTLDANGDGHMDVVINAQIAMTIDSVAQTTKHNQAFLLFGDENGIDFASERFYLTDQDAIDDLIIGDFNLDGIADIAIALPLGGRAIGEAPLATAPAVVRVYWGGAQKELATDPAMTWLGDALEYSDITLAADAVGTYGSITDARSLDIAAVDMDGDHIDDLAIITPDKLIVAFGAATSASAFASQIVLAMDNPAANFLDYQLLVLNGHGAPDALGIVLDGGETVGIVNGNLPRTGLADSNAGTIPSSTDGTTTISLGDFASDQVWWLSANSFVQGAGFTGWFDIADVNEDGKSEWLFWLEKNGKTQKYLVASEDTNTSVIGTHEDDVLPQLPGRTKFVGGAGHDSLVVGNRAAPFELGRYDFDSIERFVLANDPYPVATTALIDKASVLAAGGHVTLAVDALDTVQFLDAGWTYVHNLSDHTSLLPQDGAVTAFQNGHALVWIEGDGNIKFAEAPLGAALPSEQLDFQNVALYQQGDLLRAELWVQTPTVGATTTLQLIARNTAGYTTIHSEDNFGDLSLSPSARSVLYTGETSFHLASAKEFTVDRVVTQSQFKDVTGDARPEWISLTGNTVWVSQLGTDAQGNITLHDVLNIVLPAADSIYTIGRSTATSDAVVAAIVLPGATPQDSDTISVQTVDLSENTTISAQEWASTALHLAFDESSPVSVREVFIAADTIIISTESSGIYTWRGMPLHQTVTLGDADQAFADQSEAAMIWQRQTTHRYLATAEDGTRFIDSHPEMHELLVLQQTYDAGDFPAEFANRDRYLIVDPNLNDTLLATVYLPEAVDNVDPAVHFVDDLNGDGFGDIVVVSRLSADSVALGVVFAPTVFRPDESVLIDLAAPVDLLYTIADVDSVSGLQIEGTADHNGDGLFDLYFHRTFNGTVLDSEVLLTPSRAGDAFATHASNQKYLVSTPDPVAGTTLTISVEENPNGPDIVNFHNLSSLGDSTAFDALLINLNTEWDFATEFAAGDRWDGITSIQLNKYSTITLSDTGLNQWIGNGTLTIFEASDNDTKENLAIFTGENWRHEGRYYELDDAEPRLHTYDVFSSEGATLLLDVGNFRFNDSVIYTDSLPIDPASTLNTAHGIHGNPWDLHIESLIEDFAQAVEVLDWDGDGNEDLVVSVAADGITQFGGESVPAGDVMLVAFGDGTRLPSVADALTGFATDAGFVVAGGLDGVRIESFTKTDINGDGTADLIVQYAALDSAGVAAASEFSVIVGGGRADLEGAFSPGWLDASHANVLEFTLGVGDTLLSVATDGTADVHNLLVTYKDATETHTKRVLGNTDSSAIVTSVVAATDTYTGEVVGLSQIGSLHNAAATDSDWVVATDNALLLHRGDTPFAASPDVLTLQLIDDSETIRDFLPGGDLNNDGYADLVFVTETGFGTYLNVLFGGAVFAPPEGGGGVTELALADQLWENPVELSVGSAASTEDTDLSISAGQVLRLSLDLAGEFAEGDDAEISLAGGDVNGDGFDDLLLGLPQGNDAVAGGGEVFIFYGHRNGIDSWMANGAEFSLEELATGYASTVRKLSGEFVTGDLQSHMGIGTNLKVVDANNDGNDDLLSYGDNLGDYSDDGAIVLIYGG